MIRKFKFQAFFKQTAVVMVILMAILGMVPRVDAAFIGSPGTSDHGFKAGDVETVRQFLEMKAVKNRLEAMGYSSDEIQDRLSALSHEEIHQLARNINSLTVAGDGIGVVIGILVVILLIIIILKLLNKQVVIR